VRHPMQAAVTLAVCMLATGAWAQAPAATPAPPKGPTAIALGALLDTQAAAWNRGDLEAFCSVYTDDASFVTPKGLVQGRQVILERYRTSYPDKAAMGTLSFAVVEVRDGPGGKAASMVARWTLAYPGKDAKSGLTLLVFHRLGGAWRIVQDASM
jgi:uncharacterized protein (TIGR02246 family)